ncbi:MAG: hypothetical protein HYY13_07950 [Nitrospirae bacterium]|nr:hypothetical protein [Nitrospirota bacterium]
MAGAKKGGAREPKAAGKGGKSAAADKSDPKQLIMEEFDRELRESFGFIEEKLGKTFGGPLGAIVRKIAGELFGWFIRMGGTDRGRRSFEMIVDQAAKAGRDNVKDVIDASLDHYLKLNELFIRASKNHPGLDRLRQALREEYEARLEIYGPLMESTGETYAELVRAAFPQQATLRGLMDRQFAATERVLGLMESEDGLFKIPTLVRKPVLKVIRSAYTIMRERIEKGTDRIYRESGDGSRE